MQKNYLLFLLLILLVACSKDQGIVNIELDQSFTDPFSRTEINTQIHTQMSGDKLWYWSKAETELIWSASLQSDSIISLGYTLEDIDLSSQMDKINVNDPKWIEKKEELIQFILMYERDSRENAELKQEDIMQDNGHKTLPQIQFKNTSLELLKELRSRPDIRFIEPLGYSMEENTYRSGSGCSGSPNYNILSSDYSTITPNTKQPWNFANANIPSAWNSSQGDGITICILDTGASFNQDNLGSQFTSGNSGGRSIEKRSTKYSGWWFWKSLDSPNDACGHGTAMAGIAAAPRGTDGNALGVAYKSDLLTIRGTEDVLINSSNEKNGVRDGLVLAANRSNVKIISMSIGDIFYSSTVADGIFYAYNRGKLILAAAGTSFSITNSWWGVVFPANMSQTTAVTGVKDSGNLQRCSDCHSGSEVDFVLTMEKSGNGSTPIALATSSNQPKYTGGSSCATAMMAGIAALVWSENPGMSRSQVLNKLKNASSLYPSRSTQYGWGRVDASTAVNGN